MYWCVCSKNQPIHSKQQRAIKPPQQKNITTEKTVFVLMTCHEDHVGHRADLPRQNRIKQERF